MEIFLSIIAIFLWAALLWTLLKSYATIQFEVHVEGGEHGVDSIVFTAPTLLFILASLVSLWLYHL